MWQIIYANRPLTESLFAILININSANNFAMQHKRKTISGQDVLDAMKEMEFERFIEPLRRSLEGKSRVAQLDFHFLLCLKLCA